MLVVIDCVLKQIRQAANALVLGAVICAAIHDRVGGDPVANVAVLDLQLGRVGGIYYEFSTQNLNVATRS